MAKCCDPKYSPAALRHPIIFEQLTLTPTDTGGQTEAWSTYANAWASLTPKIKREVVFGEKLESRVVHMVICRYLAGVSTSMRIDFEGRKFQIKAIIVPDEVKEFLEIETEEFVGT